MKFLRSSFIALTKTIYIGLTGYSKITSHHFLSEWGKIYVQLP
jgi:hypothetical protein